MLLLNMANNIFLLVGSQLREEPEWRTPGKKYRATTTTEKKTATVTTTKTTTLTTDTQTHTATRIHVKWCAKPKKGIILGVHKLRLIFNACNFIRFTTWIESGCFHAHMVYLYFAHTRRSMVRRLWLRKLIEEPNQKSHRNYTSATDDSVLLYEKSQAILPSLSLYISLSFYLSVCISATLLLWCCSYSFKSLWLLVLLLFALVAFTRSENMHHFDRGCFERNQRRAEITHI